MNLSTLIRRPLVWLLVAEALMVTVLGLVTWQVWQHRVAPLAAAVAAPPRAAPLRPPPASTSEPSGLSPNVGPTPGFSTDASFLSREMAELNRVEAAFEDLEWRATSALADAIQRYVTGVVLPTVERAEGGRR